MLEEQRYRLDDLDATLTGAAMEYTGIGLRVTGDVDAQAAAPQVNIADFHIEGNAAQANNRYAVKISAPAVELNPKRIAVEKLTGSASGTMGTLQLSRSEFNVPRLHLDLEKQNVAIADLSLNAQGKSGNDAVDIALAVPKLDITPEKAGGESASLNIKLSGLQRNGAVNIKMSGLSGSAQALKIAALALDVDVKQADNAIKGSLSTPITGNLEKKQFELPKLVGDFIVASPTLPQKTANVHLSGGVKADLGAQRVNAALSTRFDQSTMEAKLQMEHFSTPAYDFDIAIDQLNVDRYLPPKPAGTTPAKEPTSASSGTEEPIDLSALKTLDVDGQLKVGQLQVKNIKSSNVRLTMRAKNGQLAVKPLAANLYGGSLAGSLAVNANANQYAIQQRLSGIQIGPLLRDAADKDILEGKGNVNLDVTTAGALVSQIKRGLNGTASLQLKDGAVKGIDLAGAVRTVKAKFGAKDAEGAAGSHERTDFSELTASFTVRNGIAKNSDLSLKSPFIRVTGAGDVNIPESSLNYVVKTAIVGTMAGQGGKEMTELKGLTIPVRVSGAFDALKYKVEFSEMLRAGGQEALKETAREAVKGQLKKQLGEGTLGTLLGGGAKSGTQTGAPGAEAPAKPADQLKDRLKGLLK
jgi:AsmA protein